MSDTAARVHRLPDGRAMGYAEYGAPNGRPLLFCHGFLGSRLSGGLLDDAASAEAIRVIVPDRPGYGLSDPKRHRRVAHWVKDATSLLDSLEIDHCAVLGVSAGGPYAVACAALLPDRVDAAGVVSGWPSPKVPRSGARLPFVPVLGRRSRLLRRLWLWRLGRRLDGDGMAVLDRARRGAASPDSELLGDARLREQLLADMREALRQGARGPARDARIVSRRWGFAIESLRVPTWLWHGQEDRNVPAAAARAMSERIPGSRTTFYRADAHFSTFVGHIAEILRALRPPL